MPFLRAFALFMDFQDNRIGFATKKTNFGAFITSDLLDDVGPPDIETGHHHGHNSDRNGIDDNIDDNAEPEINIVIIVAASILLTCTFCLIGYYCYKKR